MKLVLLLINIAMTSVLLVSACPASAFTLASKGKAFATIVVGPDATETEKYAASQLVMYLKKATGADFVISETAAVKGSRILVGQTAATKQLIGSFDWKSLRVDGILIKTVGNDLVLAGDRPRGSMYAVFTFLEDQLGVRWWTLFTESVPNKPELSINKLNIKYKPPFMYRDMFSKGIFWADGYFPSHMKTNGTWQSIPADKGGHYSILGQVHTFYELLPPSKYFATHPEWYSEIDGKRTSQSAQLCLTNEEMKKELIAQALVWIKQAPQAGIISISQNDCGGACTCPKCTALVKKTGSQSGAIISLVNSVAEEIEKQYPDYLVETLAYTYTRTAPKNIKPRENVVIRLCSIECDFAHPLTSESNTIFYTELQDWQKITKRLYIWDYTANFLDLLIPHSNFQVFGDNLRIFRKNNVVGVFEQGDGYNQDAGFGALKTWVLCKLMWNPDLDERKLMKEFLEGYYGKAAPYLTEYLNVMEKVTIDLNMYLSCSISIPTYYNAENLTKANEAMQKAMAAVKDNPELLKRVRIQNLALQHLLILTKHQFALDGTSVPGVDWSNIASDFLTLSDETGNVFIGEGSKMSEKYRASLVAKAAAPLNVPKPTPPAGYAALPKSEWIDFNDDRFMLIGEGPWVQIVADPTASDGSAAVMPGNINEWAIQLPIQSNDIIAPVVNIHASVKVKAKATSGLAFIFGVYDQTGRSKGTALNVTLDQLPNGEYQEYILRNVKLTPGMFLYFAPPGNGDWVDTVSVDRIFFTKAQ